MFYWMCCHYIVWCRILHCLVLNNWSSIKATKINTLKWVSGSEPFRLGMSKIQKRPYMTLLVPSLPHTNEREAILYLLYISATLNNDTRQKCQGWTWSWVPGLDFSLSITTATQKGCLVLFLKVCKSWEMVQLPSRPSIPQDMLLNFKWSSLLVGKTLWSTQEYSGSHKAFIFKGALEHSLLWLPHTPQITREYGMP